MKFRAYATGMVIAALALLTGCATSIVIPQHSQFATSGNEAAKVYFYRPLDQRTRGVADNDINVEVEGEHMMKLSVGEYVLVKLKPGDKVKITMRNMTYIAAKPMPEEVHRTRRFEFEAGKTYYIQAEMRMEEYRGVYFRPMDVSFDIIKPTARFLKPAGELAIANPLQ